MEHHRANSSFCDDCGGMTVIWAICMTSIFMVMTLLLDGVSVISAKRSMQSALDISALTGAKLLVDESLSDEAIQASVDASFIENLATSRADLSCQPTVPVFDRAAGDVSVDVTCSYSPMLGGTIAPQKIDVAVKSKTFISQQKLDVAMVLDLSGSMNSSGKLDALKSAAKLAAKSLVKAGRAGDIRVSYVAYSEAVNVLKYGPYALGDSATIDPLPGHVTPFYCVSERVGDGAWDDRPPGTDAYFPWGGATCPKNGLFTLSSDLTKFDKAVDGLIASSATAGHLGVAWAWYLLSPQWAGVWPEESKPHAYDDSDVRKIVILMSDGVFNNSTHIPYGTSSQQAVKLCGEMRKKGIIIFSVAFLAPPAGQQTLKDCAGDADHYFEAHSNTELISAYQEIARSLVILRIVE